MGALGCFEGALNPKPVTIILPTLTLPGIFEGPCSASMLGLGSVSPYITFTTPLLGLIVPTIFNGLLIHSWAFHVSFGRSY